MTDDKDDKVDQVQDLLDVLAEAGDRVRARHELELAAVDAALEAARAVETAAMHCADAVSADGLCFSVQRIDHLPIEFCAIYSTWRRIREAKEAPMFAAPEAAP